MPVSSQSNWQNKTKIISLILLAKGTVATKIVEQESAHIGSKQKLGSGFSLPFAEVTVGVLGVFTSSSSSDEELSDELLSSFGFAAVAGVLFAAGVVFTGALIVSSSSSELSSLEDDSFAVFETGVFAVEAGVFAVEAGVLGVAVFPLVTAGLAGVVLGASTSESELSEESELLLSAFLLLVGVTAGLEVAAGFPLVFSSSSSLELSEPLLDWLVALDTVGVAAFAAGVERVEDAGFTVLVAGVSSSESELSLSESELLSAGLDGVLGVTADFGVATGLGVLFSVAVWAAGLAGASSSELSESVSKNRTLLC